MKLRTASYALILAGLISPSSSLSKRNSETYYGSSATFSPNSRRTSGGDGPVATATVTPRVTRHFLHAHTSPTYSVSLPAHTIKECSAFTIAQWDKYFGNGLSAHLWSQADRNAVFGRLFYYQIPSFRTYVAGLEGYHEAMVNLNHKITNDPSLAYQLSHIPIDSKTSVKDFIVEEALKSAPIVAKKREDLSLAQQAAIAKQREEMAMALQKQHERQVVDIIKAQKEDLTAIVDTAKIIKESQSGNDKVILDRAYVIEKTIQEDFSARTQKHTVLPIARSLLQNMGHDPNNFTQCHGNTLQQHIHDEFVTNLNRTAMFHVKHGSNPEVRQILESAVEFTHVGIAYNNAGHVKQAMEISNLVSAIIDYGLAVAQGVGDGIVNTVHALSHPIDTATNIVNAAKTVGYYLGKVLYEILDIECTFGIDPVADQQRLLAYEKNIKAINHAIHEKYEKLSGPEMVRAATAITTEAWLTGKCLGAAKTFYGRAHAKALELASKVEQGVATAPELLASAEGLEVLVANEAAETVMLSTAENTAFGGATRTVSSKLKTMHEPITWHELDPSLGDITKLQKSEELLKNIPTPDKLQHPLVTLVENGKSNATSGNLGTARGALYELEVAVELEAKGEKVLKFGERIGKKNHLNQEIFKEFDIIAENKLIECKNLNWETIPSKKMNDLQGLFQEQNLIAKHHNKTFEVYSKQPIPTNLKEWFNKKNIIFHEGSI